MNKGDYLKILTEDIHSAAVATVAGDGHPQTRIIDMMLWDECGVYFLTARGKAFYYQLMEQQYIALSATREKIGISLRGRIKNIGNEKLDEIFEKNTYMQEIYPGDTRRALDVFCLYEAQGEYFDISDPSHIVRETIVIGDAVVLESGYFTGDKCTGCGLCLTVCPQKCIDTEKTPFVIDQHRCVHCGLCAEICPEKAIEKVNLV